LAVLEIPGLLPLRITSNAIVAMKFRGDVGNSLVMKNVFFLVAGGGFQWESLTLANQLRESWAFTFVVPESSVFSGSALLQSIQGSPYIVVPEISSRADNKVLTITRNLWRGVRLLWAEFKRVRPDAAVCVGSSMAIPIAIVCRLRGVPLIFVESITRTNALSSTGKLLLRLRLADHFYVQWPDQVQLHPRALYKGTVL